MAFSGQWEVEGKSSSYDFSASNKTVIIRNNDDGISTTTSFELNEKDAIITIGQAAAPTTTKYLIQARSDTRLVLRRVAAEGDDSMEEEVLVLIPAGLPESLKNKSAPFDEEDDGDDSGVDMGMDLCIVGKKI